MFPHVKELKSVGTVSLWVAVFMTVFTGLRYIKFGAVTAISNMSKTMQEH
jgi:hypothetical protein